MGQHEFPPAAVAQLRLRSRRVDDVREEHGGEDGGDGRPFFDSRELADARHLRLDLQARPALKQMNRCVRHQSRDVLGFVPLSLRVRVSDDQRRRRVHAREDVAHVGLPEDPSQRHGDVGLTVFLVTRA